MSDLEQTRKDLVLQLLPRVRSLAHITAGQCPGITAEDLLGAGTIGLIEIIDRWDGQATVVRYALRRAQGAMLDEVRRLRWTPRSVSDRARDLEDARRRLSQKHGCEPTLDQIAGALGLEPRAFARFRELAEVRRPAQVVTVDMLGESSLPTPHEELLEGERREAVRKAVDRLPERLGRVVRLTCLEGRRLREAAEGLGITQSRVCQLRSQALRQLRRDRGLSLAS